MLYTAPLLLQILPWAGEEGTALRDLAVERE